MRFFLILTTLLIFNVSATAKDILTIEIEGQASGVVEILLLPDVAPKHVERIKTLAESGAYDNIVFHRVIEGFMAQTGDVQFGIKGSPDIVNAGRGRSKLPNLPA